MEFQSGKQAARGVIALLLAMFAAGAAFARGGGGCLEQGTPVLTPAGCR